MAQGECLVGLRARQPPRPPGVGLLFRLDGLADLADVELLQHVARAARGVRSSALLVRNQDPHRLPGVPLRETNSSGSPSGQIRNRRPEASRPGSGRQTSCRRQRDSSPRWSPWRLVCGLLHRHGRVFVDDRCRCLPIPGSARLSVFPTRTVVVLGWRWSVFTPAVRRATGVARSRPAHGDKNDSVARLPMVRCKRCTWSMVPPLLSVPRVSVDCVVVHPVRGETATLFAAKARDGEYSRPLNLTGST